MVCDIIFTGKGAPPGSCLTKRKFVRTMNKHFKNESGISCDTPTDGCVSQWLDYSGASPAKTLPPFYLLSKEVQREGSPRRSFSRVNILP